MPHRSESLRDAKLLVELAEPCTIELDIVASDYHPVDTILIDDRFSHKALHSGFYNADQRFGFYPFNEIINCQQSEFILFNSLKKYIQDVLFPLGKRPRHYNWGQVWHWLMLHDGIPLPVIILLHKFGYILLYNWPIVALPKYFEGWRLPPKWFPQTLS